MKVLVVDDDPEILDAVAVGFRFHWRDCTVFTSQSGTQGLDLFFKHDPDIVVLDIGMPDRNGFEVLQDIRRASDTPVVLLTARQSEANQVHGLDLGADDYVIKPFSILTLLARIRAVLRRTESQPSADRSDDIVAGDLVVDSRNQSVMRDGQPLRLTPSEYRLLLQFLRNPQRLLPHQMLCERVWGSNWEVSTNDLKSLISRLRTKLGEDPHHPRYIETQRGLGYRFLLRPERGESEQDSA